VRSGSRLLRRLQVVGEEGSQRGLHSRLAAEVPVTAGHLSRVLRSADGKRPTHTRCRSSSGAEKSISPLVPGDEAVQ
jgi:hypothetical protein